MPLARGLAWDVGLPVVVCYGLYLAGVGDWGALLGATGAAAARIGWVSVRDRMLNPFAIVMLAVFGMGLALAFVNGDPRFLLLKSSIVTATVGASFLVSVARGPAAQQHWAPDIRHRYRVSSMVWGLGLLTEAIVRIPLVYLLPISVTVWLSAAMLVATLGGLIVWNAVYVASAQRHTIGIDHDVSPGRCSSSLICGDWCATAGRGRTPRCG